MSFEGLVPFLLTVFGVPGVSKITCRIASDAEDEKALQMKRLEMEIISAELRRRRAFLLKVPQVSLAELSSGREVMFY